MMTAECSDSELFLREVAEASARIRREVEAREREMAKLVQWINQADAMGDKYLVRAHTMELLGLAMCSGYSICRHVMDWGQAVLDRGSSVAWVHVAMYDAICTAVLSQQESETASRFWWAEAYSTPARSTESKL
jgi:hypothetical protein